jgi:hypothetical protein
MLQKLYQHLQNHTLKIYIYIYTPINIFLHIYEQASLKIANIKVLYYKRENTWSTSLQAAVVMFLNKEIITPQPYN